MTEHPCETCLRWPECNGVDAYRCNVVIAAEVEELEAARKKRAEELENLQKAIIPAIVIHMLPGREPLHVFQSEKDTVKKWYQKPFLPIRRQARSKLK